LWAWFLVHLQIDVSAGFLAEDVTLPAMAAAYTQGTLPHIPAYANVKKVLNTKALEHLTR
jgi:hypothetical protein